MIEMIIARCHVGDSDESVSLYLISRLKRGAWAKLTPGQSADMIWTAVESHRANQSLYVSVMGGNWHG